MPEGQNAKQMDPVRGHEEKPPLFSPGSNPVRGGRGPLLPHRACGVGQQEKEQRGSGGHSNELAPSRHIPIGNQDDKAHGHQKGSAGIPGGGCVFHGGRWESNHQCRDPKKRRVQSPSKIRSAYIGAMTSMQNKPKQISGRYHHGNLRQAMIEATLVLAEESGLERVSLREVARRLGVSSGAPFRHFRDRQALMTAIAEEATRQLRIRVERDQLTAPAAAVEKLRCLGHSFLAWAWSHPTQFKLVSSRQLFDFNASESLAHHFGAVRNLTLSLIQQAQSQGQLSDRQTPEQIGLALRASAYGLARMAIDGQLPQWGVVNPEDEHKVATSCLDLILNGMCMRGYPD